MSKKALLLLLVGSFLAITAALVIWLTGGYRKIEIGGRQILSQVVNAPIIDASSSPIIYVDSFFPGTISVTFDNPFSSDRDWIALSRKDLAINRYVDWKGLADSKAMKQVSAGTVTFTRIDPGDYEGRYSPSNTGCNIGTMTTSLSRLSPTLLTQWSFNSSSEFAGMARDYPHIWNRWALYGYSPGVANPPEPQVASGSLLILGPIGKGGGSPGDTTYLGYKYESPQTLSGTRDTVIEVIMKSSPVGSSIPAEYFMKVQLFSNAFGQGTSEIIGNKNMTAVTGNGKLKKFSVIFPATEVGNKPLKSMKIFLDFSHGAAIKDLQIDTLRVYSK